MGEGARALQSHRFLLRLALSAGNIFAWLVVFRVLHVGSGNLELALFGVGALYALSQGVMFVLTPLAGAVLRQGLRRALVYGTLASVFAFLSIAVLFAPQATLTREFVFSMVAGFVVLGGIHRALYWVPYATVLEREGTSRASFVREAAIALMPLCGGLALVVPGGAAALFVIVVITILLSLFPLTFVREGYERFVWSFGETFAALFARANRGLLFTSFLDGVQGVTLLLFWPLAVFFIVGQSYVLLGTILSATLLITFLARRVIRRVLTALGLERSVLTLAIVVFSSWVLRLVAGTPLQVFIADVYYHGGIPARRFGIDARAFEQTADAGHFVDEYTALKEMGMALGRITACALFAVLLLFGSAPVAFGVCILAAGIAAAASVLISHRMAKSVY
ncbi:MAG: hypothetical protein AAB605_01325 [Patescibacteria group bacterium]